MTAAQGDKPQSEPSPDAGPAVAAFNPAVTAYKSILREVLERRPSGMRRRLAEALGRNPSFVSQIANPTYPTPIPAAHVETILEICHFSATERARFVGAYEVAHPQRARLIKDDRRHRVISVRVPEADDPAVNQEIDRMFHELAARLGRIVEP